MNEISMTFYVTGASTWFVNSVNGLTNWLCVTFLIGHGVGKASPSGYSKDYERL